MITLYHAPDSRSSRFIWLLEELGAPYELVYCSIARRSGKGEPDPRNPHPDRRVPAIVHDDHLVTEQAAIALYLTDLFPKADLGAQIGSPDRGSYLTWLAYYAGEIDIAYSTRSLNPDITDPFVLTNHRRITARVASALAKGPYLMGDRFTAADILASGPFEWDPGLAASESSVREWVARLAARPAARKMMAMDQPE